MAGNLRRVLGHTYVLSPTGVAADDTAAMNALIDGIPAGVKARVIIRDNGQPLRLGTVGGVEQTKSILGKGIFFQGETPNARIIWGVGAGTGTQGLYSLLYGGGTSPLQLSAVMPSNVTRAAMGSISARFSKISSPSLALARNDRVLVFADGPQKATVGPHHKGGSQRPGELHRVQWSNGTDYVLDNYVYDDMTVNPRIAKIVPLEGCGMADLMFGYEGPAARAVQYNYLDIRYTLGFVFENIQVDDTGVGTVYTHCNDKMRVSGYNIAHQTFSSEYGILDVVNRDLLIEDMHTRFIRHIHTTGGISDISKQWTVAITSTSGSYTLNINGTPTVSLAYNASAATVQSALETIVGVGNIVVQAWAGGGNFYTVTTTGSIIGNNNSLTLPGATVSGTTSTLTLGGGTVKLEAGVARYGNSRNTRLKNCKCSIGGLSTNAVQYGFDTHPEGIDTDYFDCTVEIGAQDNGSTGAIGFMLRSRGQKFYDCAVKSNSVYATVIRSLTTGWQQQGGSGMELHRCRAENVWIGVDMKGDFFAVNQDDILIKSSIFSRCTGNAVRSTIADGGFGVVDGIQIEDSKFFNCCESVGASTAGAVINITQGTNHKLRRNVIDRDVNRYAFSFESLTSTNVEVIGNHLRNYTNIGSGKMGIRGQSGDPYGVSEATANGFQTAYGSLNYTT